MCLHSLQLHGRAPNVSWAAMRVLQALITFVGTIALAVTIVAAGFLVCLLPPVTHGLSSVFATDEVSPFDRAQLAQVADATRDYAFGSHDLTALYRTIYEVDRAYADELAKQGGAPTGAFPSVVARPATANAQDFARANAGASEQYCYTPDAIAHLDDCNAIVHFAYPFIVVVALIALASSIWNAHRAGRRRAGIMLRVAGIVVLVAFIALGVWAVVDFGGFFTAFHGAFFSQGNWTFAYDSLLICALPTAFWIGMGALWLIVSVLLSVLAILVGGRLMRRRR